MVELSGERRPFDQLLKRPVHLMLQIAVLIRKSLATLRVDLEQFVVGLAEDQPKEKGEI